MSKKGGGSGNDSKFFQNTNRKGETHELKLELNAPEKNKKKDAVKKVRNSPHLGLPCSAHAALRGQPATRAYAHDSTASLVMLSRDCV